jgi:hypothetical protein
MPKDSKKPTEGLIKVMKLVIDLNKITQKYAESVKMIAIFEELTVEVHGKVDFV